MRTIYAACVEAAQDTWATRDDVRVAADAIRGADAYADVDVDVDPYLWEAEAAGAGDGGGMIVARVAAGRGRYAARAQAVLRGWAAEYQRA